MNISNAALAAVIFAGGTAVGFATGTQVVPDSGEGERLASVESAALIEDQKLISNSISRSEPALENLSADVLSDQETLGSQFEELNRRREQAAQRESELDAQSEQLEEKLASLKVLEEDLARMHENLRVDGEALEERQAELDKQGEMNSAQLRSVLERESQLVALQQKLAAQSAAASAQDLAETTEAKLDLHVDRSVSRTGSNPALSDVELSAIALQEPTNVDKSFEEGSQPEQFSEAEATESDPAIPNNGPIAEVHFELNSAKLTPGALMRAREAADRLQTMKFSKIRISGHTDTTGNVGRNRALSNARAEAVAEIFVQSGLSRQMIEIVGFGETYDMLPVSTGDGISEPLNRCVGIFVEEIAQSSLQ